ncbi:unnamed protein product [Adineta steineri]|uniref:Uncharacterized protein n=1 Tax=Adineta steineri TaxID=433720 RepID=A0A815S2F9_9BILA|nr:unnamed protein product [Adineta steineri]CAF1486030.1 unnamed protein product [Adineta steineri]
MYTSMKFVIIYDVLLIKCISASGRMHIRPVLFGVILGALVVGIALAAVLTMYIKDRSNQVTSLHTLRLAQQQRRRQLQQRQQQRQAQQLRRRQLQAHQQRQAQQLRRRQLQAHQQRQAHRQHLLQVNHYRE